VGVCTESRTERLKQRKEVVPIFLRGSEAEKNNRGWTGIKEKYGKKIDDKRRKNPK